MLPGSQALSIMSGGQPLPYSAASAALLQGGMPLVPGGQTLPLSVVSAALLQAGIPVQPGSQQLPLSAASAALLQAGIPLVPRSQPLPLSAVSAALQAGMLVAPSTPFTVGGVPLAGDPLAALSQHMGASALGSSRAPTGASSYASQAPSLATSMAASAAQHYPHSGMPGPKLAKVGSLNLCMPKFVSG